MKDFNLPGIREYEVPFPAPIPADQVGALLRKVFYKSFSIPLKNGETLMAIFVHNGGITKVALSVFHQGDSHKAIRPVTIKEVNKIRELFLDEDESLLWIYDWKSNRIVSHALKNYNQSAYEVSNFNVHFFVEKNISLPFEYAYSKVPQKNRSHKYIRGSFGDYKFLHLQTKDPFPWGIFESISQMEFQKSKTGVIFSKYTEPMENDFILWQF